MHCNGLENKWTQLNDKIKQPKAELIKKSAGTLDTVSMPDITDDNGAQNPNCIPDKLDKPAHVIDNNTPLQEISLDQTYIFKCLI